MPTRAPSRGRTPASAAPPAGETSKIWGLILSGRLAIVQIGSNGLAIADYDNAPGSGSLKQGFGAPADWRGGMCGAASDDDDAMAAGVRRHEDGTFHGRGFRGKCFNGSFSILYATVYAQLYEPSCLGDSRTLFTIGAFFRMARGEPSAQQYEIV